MENGDYEGKPLVEPHTVTSSFEPHFLGCLISKVTTLCLDCMKHSPKKRSKYWKRSSHQDGYDKDCRIEHGETSWDFSFMGYRSRVSTGRLRRKGLKEVAEWDGLTLRYFEAQP